MSTIVTPSLQTLQVFALIATIVFGVTVVVAAMGSRVNQAIVVVLTLIGLTCLALALLFGG
jgi:hypothetical protein